MGPIRIRQVLLASRRRLAVVCAVLALGGVLSLHHSASAMGAMDHGMTTGMTVCLAIVVAVATAVAVVVTGLLPWRQSCPASDLLFLWSSVPLRPPLARARAGPIVLQVLRR
ncbi:MAG: hypothetical protein ACYC91_16880 [Solirubrobacteraceae bacterium]